jgi:flagellar protein FliO/FliZ
MPSIARTIGLIFVVANPACLMAQASRPDSAPYGRPDTPSIGYFLPSGQSAGLEAGQIGAGSARSPHPGSPTGFREPAQFSGEGAAAVPLSPRGGESPLPLAPPGYSNRTQQDQNNGLSSVVTVAGSLALVLGIFFLVAWGIRRAAPAGCALLPNEVFEVLGRAPLPSRQQVYLFRCGQKLVLVSVTAAGAETLAEITDPIEVDRLAGLCRQAHPNSATAAFRQVLGQFAPQRPAAAFPGGGGRDDARPAGAGVLNARDGLENRDV